MGMRSASREREGKGTVCGEFCQAEGVTQAASFGKMYGALGCTCRVPVAQLKDVSRPHETGSDTANPGPTLQSAMLATTRDPLSLSGPW